MVILIVYTFRRASRDLTRNEGQRGMARSGRREQPDAHGAENGGNEQPGPALRAAGTADASGDQERGPENGEDVSGEHRTTAVVPGPPDYCGRPFRCHPPGTNRFSRSVTQAAIRRIASNCKTTGMSDSMGTSQPYRITSSWPMSSRRRLSVSGRDSDWTNAFGEYRLPPRYRQSASKWRAFPRIHSDQRPASVVSFLSTVPNDLPSRV